MIIPKPTSVERVKENRYSTRLYFKEGGFETFYIRGAISWPIVDRVVSDDGKVEGFALVAGQHLRTKKIWIFEECQFWSIDNWLNDDQTLKRREDGRGFYLGLKNFVRENMLRYLCDEYFYGGKLESSERFRSQLYDEVKGVSLIELPDVEDVGEGLFNEAAQQEKIAGDSRSVLSEHLKMSGLGVNGGYLALRSLLVGLHTYPWIDLGRKNWHK